MPIMPKLPSRKEAMRIAGKLVSTDDVIEVKNPYDGSLVGTVPMARPEHVREAFQKAKDFKPKLSRYERQQILQKTAQLLLDRREEFARLISAESGLCWKDAIYESTRAYDVWSFAGSSRSRMMASSSPATSPPMARRGRSSRRACLCSA